MGGAAKNLRAKKKILLHAAQESKIPKPVMAGLHGSIAVERLPPCGEI